jgi:AraC-like DNA-binding protein
MLWVDLTVASKGHHALPIGMDIHFDIRRMANVDKLGDRLSREASDVVAFEFDYPDRDSLQLMLDLKNAHRSIPMIMVTLQHSEKLAVWAFRSKLVDFLVKPVPQVDIDRCYRMLLEMSEAKAGQDARSPTQADVQFPIGISGTPANVDKAFLPAIYHVVQNFDQKIQNDEVANLCSMSPYRFSRGFKAVFGISFREYLIRYRLREACHLLKNVNASVTDVAFAVGFSDVSHFSKMFKRHFGVSPSDKLQGTGRDESPTLQLEIPADLLRESAA